MNLREPLLIQTLFLSLPLLSGQFAFSSLAVITDMNGRDGEGVY